MDHYCPEPEVCPMTTTVNVIGGKWKLTILWHLQDGPLRYGELQKNIGSISPKMLAVQLKELERDDIIKRTVHKEVPPKVLYELTDYGRTLDPILNSMGNWGSVHQMREKRMAQIA